MDHFTASEDVFFPVTLGEFVKFCEDAAAAGNLSMTCLTGGPAALIAQDFSMGFGALAGGNPLDRAAGDAGGRKCADPHLERK